MIYKGTNFIECIQMTPMDRMHSTQWIEMRRFADDNEFEVFLCDDYGDHRHVWSWVFELDKPMTYEQVKFNIMEHMFECDTMDELADTLSEVFEDGFGGVLIEDDDYEDECNCDCDCCECCECREETREGGHIMIQNMSRR